MHGASTPLHQENDSMREEKTYNVQIKVQMYSHTSKTSEVEVSEAAALKVLEIASVYGWETIGLVDYDAEDGFYKYQIDFSIPITFEKLSVLRKTVASFVSPHYEIMM